MSPTTILQWCTGPVQPCSYQRCTGRVYPGWWDEGGSWEGYTGYYPGTHQDPYLVIFHASGPTYGQMKAFSKVYDEVS